MIILDQDSAIRGWFVLGDTYLTKVTKFCIRETKGWFVHWSSHAVSYLSELFLFRDLQALSEIKEKQDERHCDSGTKLTTQPRPR